MHDIALILSFTTRGVVRRGTKLYALVASPVQVKGVNSVIQNNQTRRAFFGDETKASMQEVFPRMLKDLLKSIEANDAVDSTPWYAAKWTDAQKAAANAEFVSL